jgi:hypothetical protein
MTMRVYRLCPAEQLIQLTVSDYIRIHAQKTMATKSSLRTPICAALLEDFKREIEV